MSTVFVGERPPEVEAWLQRRRELGQDKFDEVWEGEYHVAPIPHGRHGRLETQLARLLGPRADGAGLYQAAGVNLGVKDDYRIPDQTYSRSPETSVYYSTLAIAVEIVSPGDETYRKFDFYFRHDVEELLVVGPDRRTVAWYARGTDEFEPVAGSALLGITTEELHAEIDWPD